jgi:AcrR family transcriptional regulator
MEAGMTLRERRKKDTIEEIAQAATELFNRDGFEATSVEGIAAAAGCSPRTFYRYFGNKEDNVTQAEEVVLDCLCRHRGTTPETDEPAALMAVAAVGAYRVTLLTHSPKEQAKLAMHLRQALGRVTISDARPVPR